MLAFGIPFIESLNPVQMVLSSSLKESEQRMGLFHRKKAGGGTGFDTQHKFYNTIPELLYVVSKLVFLQR